MGFSIVFSQIFLGDPLSLLPFTITPTSACALSIPSSLYSTFLLQISAALINPFLWLLFPLPWSPVLFHCLYLHSYTHIYTSKQTKIYDSYMIQNIQYLSPGAQIVSYNNIFYNNFWVLPFYLNIIVSFYVVKIQCFLYPFFWLMDT